MRQSPKHSPRKRAGGFTLIEAVIVAAIGGTLAAVAVPQYFKMIEKPHSAEAIDWLTRLTQAQEYYRLRHGSYYQGPSDAAALSSSMNFGQSLSGYSAGPVSSSGASWSLILTRTTDVPVFGAYEITYTYTAPGPAAAIPPGPLFDCSEANCVAQLMPPMTSGGILSGGSDPDDPPPPPPPFGGDDPPPPDLNPLLKKP